MDATNKSTPYNRPRVAKVVAFTGIVFVGKALNQRMRAITIQIIMPAMEISASLLANPFLQFPVKSKLKIPI